MYKKYYPYLLNNYYNAAEAAARQDIPENRRTFFEALDNITNQRKYVKIVLLDWDEEPIKEVQGTVISGSISKDASSNVRRTANFTTSVNKSTYDINSLQADYSANKKIFLEVGIKNDTKWWKEYPILWFPQGVFFISQANINSASNSAVNLSVQLVDKMAMLNGLVGGTFPAPVILDSQDDRDEFGKYVEKKTRIYDIIQELVHHYGGEPLENIIIEGVPKRIKQRCSWCGATPLYMGLGEGLDQDNHVIQNYTCYLDKVDNNLKELHFGESAGYVLTDFVYRGDLTASEGETIASVLDKIKNMLGNYEYFYDEYGLFHFREIKNYLNTTFATTVERKIKEEDYLFDRVPTDTEYEFSGMSNLLQLNRSPNFSNIKNDYIVHGYQELTNSSIQRQLMYHLAIDRKPTITSFTHLIFYRHPGDKLVHAYDCSWNVNNLARPADGAEIDLDRIYVEGDKGYIWFNNQWKEVELISTYYINPEGSKQKYFTPQNWQTQLYLESITSHGLEESAYAKELKVFWPTACVFTPIGGKDIPLNMKKVEEVLLPINECKYYLDFLDDISGFGEYSVSNIGRRTVVSQNKDINCLAEQNPPDFCFIDVNASPASQKRDKEESVKKYNSKWVQVPHNIYSQLSMSGFEKGALEELKYQLYLHTSYQNNLSLTVIPNFWLEPNTCVSITDETTGTFGSYLVKHITVPLDISSSMPVNCVENVSRTY